MIGNLIQQASSYAASVDSLIMLITVLVGFWFFLAEGIFFYLIWKFRASANPKAQYITGTEKHETKWIHIPHYLVLVCDVFIIVASYNVWNEVKLELPEPDVEIRIIGQQWAWTFQHPGVDGALDTADDIFTVDELHVENGLVYHFKLEAVDVIHSFSVPVFRLKQDALPGRSITGWFQPTVPGEFDIQCAEICGFGHSLMAARIFVEETSEHSAWVAANAPQGT